MNARSTPSSANPSFSSTRRIGAFRRSVVACTRGYPFSSSHSANNRTASLPTPFPRSPSKRTIPISQTPGGAKRASPRAWIVPTRRPSLSIARLSRPPDHSPEWSSACFCASTPLETTLPVVPARASITRSSSSGRTGRSTTRSLSSRSTGLIVEPLAGRPNTGSTRPRRPLSIVVGVIEVRGLTKDYGDKRAVDGLTFTVQPGVVTGFLGPNGSGKSTTMRLILGLDRPNAGTATVNGKLYRDHVAPLHEVGALLEARSVHTGRSAYNHLRALAETHGIPRSRVDELVDLVGLHDVARKRAGTFSLGMGQRLGIASALLGDPHTLLLDEPANGLDPEGIHWMRNLLTSLAAEGRAVFVSSHLMSEMSLTAERLIVIGRGRLIADTTVEDFIRNASRRLVRVRSPQALRLRDLVARDGVTVTSEEPGLMQIEGMTAAEVGDVAGMHQIVLHELTPVQASLEEAFMELTRDEVEYKAPSAVPPASREPERAVV